jgi:hypothetical protein
MAYYRLIDKLQIIAVLSFISLNDFVFAENWVEVGVAFSYNCKSVLNVTGLLSA